MVCVATLMLILEYFIILASHFKIEISIMYKKDRVRWVSFTPYGEWGGSFAHRETVGEY